MISGLLCFATETQRKGIFFFQCLRGKFFYLLAIRGVPNLIDVISRKVLTNKELSRFRFIYQQNGVEAPNKANQPL